MGDPELYQAISGLGESWTVERVALKDTDRAVDVWVGEREGTRFSCPECGGRSPIYDRAERRWRQLDRAPTPASSPLAPCSSCATKSCARSRAACRRRRHAATFGASLRAVQKWMALARTGTSDALTLKKRGRRPRGGALTAAQTRQVRRLVVNKMPDQLALPIYFWTREAMRQLIAQRTGVRLALNTVGQYMCTWGLTPQKPVRRAYERNDAAITCWLAEEYPAIAAQARRARATISWADEMGVRSDHLTGTSYAPAGQTPVVWATGQRFGCNVISAIAIRGVVTFRVFQGRFTAPVFIDFLKRLLKQAPTSWW